MSKVLKVEAIVNFRVKVQLAMVETMEGKEIIEQLINEAEDTIHAHTNGSSNGEFDGFVNTEVLSVKSKDEEFLKRTLINQQTSPVLIQEEPDFDKSILGFNDEEFA